MIVFDGIWTTEDGVMARVGSRGSGHMAFLREETKPMLGLIDGSKREYSTRVILE